MVTLLFSDRYMGIYNGNMGMGIWNGNMEWEYGTLLFSDRYEAGPGNIEMTNGNVDT